MKKDKVGTHLLFLKNLFIVYLPNNNVDQLLVKSAMLAGVVVFIACKGQFSCTVSNFCESSLKTTSFYNSMRKALVFCDVKSVEAIQQVYFRGGGWEG